MLTQTKQLTGDHRYLLPEHRKQPINCFAQLQFPCYFSLVLYFSVHANYNSVEAHAAKKSESKSVHLCFLKIVGRTELLKIYRFSVDISVKGHYKNGNLRKTM